MRSSRAPALQPLSDTKLPRFPSYWLHKTPAEVTMLHSSYPASYLMTDGYGSQHTGVKRHNLKKEWHEGIITGRLSAKVSQFLISVSIYYLHTCLDALFE